MRILIGIALIVCTIGVQATPSWHWNDRFSEDERAGLTRWIEHSFHGLRALLGERAFRHLSCPFPQGP
jgi:hypothetical protein